MRAASVPESPAGPDLGIPEPRQVFEEPERAVVTDRGSSGPRLLVTELLDPERIKIPLESTDKEGLIGELSALLARACGVPAEAETIREAVMERERVLSTGIGDGVAIPHGKTGRVGELVLVAGTTPEAVDFEALDGRPVRLLMMLVGPESAAGLHVKVLSRISRLLRRRELRERLLAAPDPAAFLALVREAESP